MLRSACLILIAMRLRYFGRAMLLGLLSLVISIGVRSRISCRAMWYVRAPHARGAATASTCRIEKHVELDGPAQRTVS